MSEKPPDIEGIADLALGEIEKRFKERPQDIPDHVLAKWFTDAIRVAERRAAKVAEEESKPFVLLDELPTLPRERGVKLAEERISELNAEIQTLRDWVEGQAPGEDLPDLVPAPAEGT